MEPQVRAVAETVDEVWYWPVVRGVVAIVFGAIAIVSPEVTTLAVMLAIGVFAIVDGLVEFAYGLGMRRRHRSWSGHVAIGVLGVAVGVTLLVWPVKTAVVLIWLVGLWAVLAGLAQVVLCVVLRTAGWVAGALAGVVIAAVGGVVLVNVGVGLLSIVWLIGLGAIAWGVALVVFGWELRRLAKAGVAPDAQ